VDLFLVLRFDALPIPSVEEKHDQRNDNRAALREHQLPEIGFDHGRSA
jgi:hypothetical protein